MIRVAGIQIASVFLDAQKTWIGTNYGLFEYDSDKKSLSKKNTYSTSKLKRVGFLNGIFLFLATYFFVKSTIGSNLGVVYTINSFSLLIPIILSIFLYKEHFDMKKGLAIVLTIASLFFLR